MINKKYVYIHEECGKPAFFSDREMKISEAWRGDYFVLPDGSNPVGGEQIVCGSCGKPMSKSPTMHLNPDYAGSQT